MTKRIKKITCEECTESCCINWRLEYKNDKMPMNLKEYPVGSFFNFEGITLERNEVGLWDCVYFNKKTRKCKVYDIRPILCRGWYCEHHRRKSKFPKGNRNDTNFYISKDKVGIK